VIYGNFDLGQTQQPKSADRQKIAALVTEWGGHVQKDINVDTDFVVMGKEPTVGTFSPDELQDPLNRRLQEDQETESKAYESELDKAKELHIPIMNQNRFLYFCGYYDNAQR
jgi:NAD-dependent DNA ligase